MIYISYRGIYEGNDFQDANTPKQIAKAMGYGFSCMVDVWKEGDKFYLGNDSPVTEVTAVYLQNRNFYINARNAAMITYLQSQSLSLYPNWFYFTTPTPPPDYVTASNGKLITPGTLPINNNSIVFLPEINDASLYSTVNLKCYGVLSNYLTLIRRMRYEGIWY
jgi:hypothetical protein